MARRLVVDPSTESKRKQMSNAKESIRTTLQMYLYGLAPSEKGKFFDVELAQDCAEKEHVYTITVHRENFSQRQWEEFILNIQAQTMQKPISYK